MQYEIEMDLCQDYTEIVQDWMRKRGIQSKKTGEELWYDYYNFLAKHVTPQKRKVNYPKDFTCPSKAKHGLNLLVQKFEDGEDVSPHLSKKADMPSEFDGLLYDWGIYHFHLGETKTRDGYIERTGPLLFARIDEVNVYCIAVCNHGKGFKSPWFMQDMVRIINDNWPETIANGKLPNGIKTPNISDEEYALLRNNGISTITQINKGVGYSNLGGGYTATGHSQKIRLRCQQVHNTLKLKECHIRDNITSYIKQIEEGKGKTVSVKLRFKLVEINNTFYIEEVKSKTPLYEVQLPLSGNKI